MKRERMDYKDTARRIEKLETAVEKLDIKLNTHSVYQAQLDEKIGHVLQTLNELKDGLDMLKTLPARRYEGVVMAVLSALASAAIGFFFAKLV